MEFLYLIFYVCLKLQFLDVETNPVLLSRGKMPRARGMAANVRDCFGAFRQPKFECRCFEMLVFRVCGVRQNLYMYSLYLYPDLYDRIFYCLLAWERSGITNAAKI